MNVVYGRLRLVFDRVSVVYGRVSVVYGQMSRLYGRVSGRFLCGVCSLWSDEGRIWLDN